MNCQAPCYATVRTAEHRTARTCFISVWISQKQSFFYVLPPPRPDTQRGCPPSWDPHSQCTTLEKLHTLRVAQPQKRIAQLHTLCVLFTAPSLKLKLLLMRRPLCLKINSLTQRALEGNTSETKIKMSRREAHYKYCYDVKSAWFAET